MIVERKTVTVDVASGRVFATATVLRDVTLCHTELCSSKFPRVASIYPFLAVVVVVVAVLDVLGLPFFRPIPLSNTPP